MLGQFRRFHTDIYGNRGFAVVLHPRHREVTTLMSEPIVKGDGARKSGCECNNESADYAVLPLIRPPPTT